MNNNDSESERHAARRTEAMDWARPMVSEARVFPKDLPVYGPEEAWDYASKVSAASAEVRGRPGPDPSDPRAHQEESLGVDENLVSGSSSSGTSALSSSPMSAFVPSTIPRFAVSSSLPVSAGDGPEEALLKHAASFLRRKWGRASEEPMLDPEVAAREGWSAHRAHAKGSEHDCKVCKRERAIRVHQGTATEEDVLIDMQVQVDAFAKAVESAHEVL